MPCTDLIQNRASGTGLIEFQQKREQILFSPGLVASLAESGQHTPDDRRVGNRVSVHSYTALMHLYDTVWYQSKSDFCRRHPQHQRVAVALKRDFGLKAILLEELIAEPTAAMARRQQNKRIVLQAGKIHRLAEIPPGPAP